MSFTLPAGLSLEHLDYIIRHGEHVISQSVTETDKILLGHNCKKYCCNCTVNERLKMSITVLQTNTSFKVFGFYLDVMESRTFICSA